MISSQNYFFSSIKLILWTPVRVPLKISEGDGYSLLRNSVPFKLCQKESNEKKSSDKTTNSVNVNESSSPLSLLKDITFWFVLFAYAAFCLRLRKQTFVYKSVANDDLVTFLAWISAGWPEWVVEDDDDVDEIEFNSEINRLLGVGLNYLKPKISRD